MLEKWRAAIDSADRSLIPWSNILHEEERYWAWLFYLYGRENRGEYYNGAVEFPVIRNIHEQWIARLAGKAGFTLRRVESATYYPDITQVYLFPTPNKDLLKEAMAAFTKVISSSELLSRNSKICHGKPV